MTNAAHHVMLGEEAVEDTKQGPDGCFVAMGCHVAVAAMLLLYKQFSKTRAANIVRYTFVSCGGLEHVVMYIPILCELIPF